MSGQPFVYHWTTSFSHQVVLDWMMMMMSMDEKEVANTDHEKVWILIKAGFHLGQLRTEKD